MIGEVGIQYFLWHIFAGRVALLDAGQPVFYVKRIGDLAHLAIRDDVDSGIDLFGNGVGHGLGDACVERGGILQQPLVMLDQQVIEIGRTRQAAHMGCQDAIGAEFYDSCSLDPVPLGLKSEEDLADRLKI